VCRQTTLVRQQSGGANWEELRRLAAGAEAREAPGQHAQLARLELVEALHGASWRKSSVTCVTRRSRELFTGMQRNQSSQPLNASVIWPVHKSDAQPGRVAALSSVHAQNEAADGAWDRARTQDQGSHN